MNISYETIVARLPESDQLAFLEALINASDSIDEALLLIKSAPVIYQRELIAAYKAIEKIVSEISDKEVF